MDPIDETLKSIFKKLINFDLKRVTIIRSIGLIILGIVLPGLLYRGKFEAWTFLALIIIAVTLLICDYVWFKMKYLLRPAFIFNRLVFYPFINLFEINIPSKKKLESLINLYKLPDGSSFFDNLDFKMPLRYRNEEGTKVKKKPYVLIKVKPRPYLPWVDALYFVLANDLSNIGFIPIIYVYDFPYHVARQAKVKGIYANDRLEIESGDDVKGEVKLTIKGTKQYILSIAGAASRIKLGSSFFKSSGKAHDFHQFLYGKAFPSFINGLNDHYRQIDLTAMDARYRSNKELFYKLIGYPTMHVAESICKKRPLLIVQWEGRAEKLIAEDKEGWQIPALKTKTLYKENGQPIEIYNSYYLTDSEEVLRDKIKNNYTMYGGSVILKYVCGMLLHRTNKTKTDWVEFLITETDCIKIIQTIKGMSDFLPPEFASSASEYYQIQFTDPKDLNTLRTKANNLTDANECYLKYVFVKGILDFQKEFNINID